MNRQTVKRLMTKGIMVYVAVFALVLMVAMPAMALIAGRNSVNRRSIINGEVTYKDIAKSAVRTSKIAPKAVRYGKIADGAVRRRHIRDGAVTAAKINRTGLNADLLDGSHASAFAPTAHNHDAAYVNDNAGEVGSADIAPQAVNSDKIKDGSITNDNIALNAQIDDSKLKYSGKTKYLTIAGAAFRPEKDDVEFTISGIGTIYAQAPATDTVYFFAPVHLPNGATVGGLRLNVWDNHADEAEARLFRRRDSGLVQLLGNISSSVNETGWGSFDDNIIINNKIVENEEHAYYVQVKLSGNAGSNLKLSLVRITYYIAAP